MSKERTKEQDLILAKIKKFWRKTSELRFAQVVTFLIHEASEGKEMYYLEDAKLLEKLNVIEPELKKEEKE